MEERRGGRLEHDCRRRTRRDQGSRDFEEGRVGRGRTYPLPHPHGNQWRRSAQSSWGESPYPLPGPCVPTRVRQVGDRRKVSSRSERPTSSAGRSPRGLDDEPSRSRKSSRGGRASRLTGEGCSPRRRRQEGGGEEEDQKQLIREQVNQEEKEEEKEREEEAQEGPRGSSSWREEEGGCEEVGWKAPTRGRSKEAPNPVRRNGPRRKRKDPCQGTEQGKEVCVEEEGEVQHIIGEFDEQLSVGGGRRHSGRRTLLRSEQGPGCGRKVSRDTQLRDPPDDAAEPFDTTGRRSTGLCIEAGGNSLLQAGDLPKSQWSTGSGDVDASHLDRPFTTWSTSSCLRRALPATEVVREHGSGNYVADSTKDGGSSTRAFLHGSSGGASISAKRILSGSQDLLPGKRKGERKVEGRQVGLQGRLQRWKRERSGEEGREGPEEASGKVIYGSYDGRPLDDPGWSPECEIEADAVMCSGQCVGALGDERPGNGPKVIGSPDYEDVSHPARLIEPVDGGGSMVLEQGTPAGTSRLSEEKEQSFGSEFKEGDSLGRLGNVLLQQLLEVFLSLRSKPTGGRNPLSVFPLPTSRSVLVRTCPSLSDDEITWLLLVCLCLNSLWGGDVFCDSDVTGAQRSYLCELCMDVSRICGIEGKIEVFDWSNFFKSRTVDYQGDEVKVARSFSWDNVSPALPREIGKVPLSEICTLGCKYYVDHFDLFIKPRDQWPDIKKPKVMVHDSDWGAVCEGLVDAGVCTYMPVEDLFEGPDGPLLNGLFGVTKDEMHNGFEVYRLIMNLIPLNSICESLAGDVNSLPGWSLMNPFFMQPSEQLLISSEDVRCFFYVMRVPDCWVKYLGFNKVVPDHILPDSLKGRETYLAARVLPMGFLNSVSLAQHVHRNLVLQSPDDDAIRAEEELRKDKSFSRSQRNWRVYLDNFDLLEKVESSQVVSLQGTTAPALLALREQYSFWEVPRNYKKTVCREVRAEVQGAQIDGKLGVAYPRESKLLKYVAAGLAACRASLVTQRQMQVVCGGLVYLSMFRRPLLGCLNQVWKFIESFNTTPRHRLPLPNHCKLEILRFLGLMPLARLDFRLPVDPQITCSDAFSSGGGICASAGLTPMGVLSSQGCLRGNFQKKGQAIRSSV